ncbi:MAG TPA: hypothetical protein VGM90_14590 [Kofleriaceae bacterium]|jgi:hypothetical protein
MGADIIGWRECPLQRSLGQKGFLGKLKMRAYMAAVESQVPEGERENVAVTVVVNDTERDLTYREIRAEAEQFQAGIPECASCPLSGGRQLGCYKFVKYPVDAGFEEVAFEMFCSQLTTKDSISDQLYRDIVSKQPLDSAWHTRRGEGRGFARRPQPLTHTWGGLFSKKKVDSAQLLASLFIPLSVPALIVGYARFWRELVQFADAKLAAVMKQHGVALGPNGQIKLQVEQSQIGNIENQLRDASNAMSSLLEGTFGEIRNAAAMMQVLAPASVQQGWSVIVDG